jgi:hypothetical protein
MKYTREIEIVDVESDYGRVLVVVSMLALSS